MQIIDLSHTIENGMPVYPGTQPPLIETPLTIDANGFQEKKLSFFSHTGTHVDAPAHIIAGASSLDQLMLDSFVGRAFVMDISANGKKSIEKEDLAGYAGQFEEFDFALFYSGWSDFWGNEKYFQDYPVLSEEAADWICQYDLKGIGIDACSFDTMDSNDLVIHNKLLDRGFVLIENLANLSGLPDMPFMFSCLPLKIKAADGSPVRAVALLI